MDTGTIDTTESTTAIPTKEIHPDWVWPIGKKSAMYTCVIVFLLGFMDCLDRQIMAALFPFLKADWGLSDTQLGSLMAIVNLSIALLVTPSAYFIDRWSRKGMMVVMGTVWSLATGACAFATGFTSLLVARFVVGFGEAGYNPAAQALLAASFPKVHRASAIAMAQFGMMLGTPAGLVVGAYIGTHWGWRHAFGVVAIPGLIISFLALLIKDYKTVKHEPATTKTSKKNENFLHVILKMFSTPTLLCMYVGATCFLLYTAATSSWMPSYYMRVGGVPVQTAANFAGLTSISSFIAVLVMAPFVDFLRKKWSNAATAWLAFALIGGICLRLIGFLVLTPASYPQVFCFLLTGILWGTIAIIGPTVILDITHPSNRATAISLLVFCQNILGMSVGPLIAGAVSDKFGIETSLILLLVFPVIASVAYVISYFTYPKDLAKVGKTEIVFVK